jgi:hypothetical protein
MDNLKLVRDPVKARKLTVLDLFRNPEIGNLDPTLIIDQNVRTLDIPMDNVPLVQVIQSGQDLPDEVLDERFLKRAIVVQEGRDGSTRDVFEENVQVGLVCRRICQGFEGGRGTTR